MKTTYWVLTIACILVFGIRLFMAFTTPGLSGDDAYFHLRQIENIRETGLPLFDDPLSYGGREYFFSPVFHYLIAAGSLIMPIAFAVKIIPNLFATLLIIIIFFIVQKLSKKDNVALFIAFFSAFVPVWFAHTINTLSIATLAVPLLFFVVYALLRIKEKKWRYLYLIGLVLFSFTHPLALLFVLGLMIYMMLLLVEKLKIDRTELEVTLFSIFFVLWSQFILYKKFILVHGPAVIWQNIPPQLLTTLFSEVTILTAIYQIGILPVLYGVFVVYRYLFRRKHKMTYFLIAFTLAAGLLLWFRLIPLQLGLILLGMFLLVLFSKWIEFYLAHIAKTRFHNWKPFFISLLVIAFIVTSIVPSLTTVEKDTVSDTSLKAFAWIVRNTKPDSIIIADVSEGHKITAFTGRKNVIDSHFLLQKDAKKRLHDVNRIFATKFDVEVIELITRYNANVIFLSPETKKAIGITSLTYAHPSQCFGRTFDENDYEIVIKHPFCEVERIR